MYNNTKYIYDNFKYIKGIYISLLKYNGHVYDIRAGGLNWIHIRIKPSNIYSHWYTCWLKGNL